MNIDRRLLYPDVVKFIAIFIVTWSHCAQRVAGATWTNLLGGAELDIAFNMPLFMIISGWFINPEKIRKTRVVDFVSSKFKRLLIPSIVWYLIHVAILLTIPDKRILTYYWYLNALFISQCVILLFCKLSKNNTAVILSSTLVVLACPYSDFCHVNFMFPFLWGGYYLRRFIENGGINKLIWIFAVVGVVLCFWWGAKYTVYVTPFKIMDLTSNMVFVYVYRFLIGFCLSAVIIYVVYKLENQLKRISVYGQYSLIIYTFSLAILSVLKNVFNEYSLHTNQYVIIDLLSLALCLVIVFIAIVLRNLCLKSKFTKTLLLGE